MVCVHRSDGDFASVSYKKISFLKKKKTFFLLLKICNLAVIALFDHKTEIQKAITKRADKLNYKSNQSALD